MTEMNTHETTAPEPAAAPVAPEVHTKDESRLEHAKSSVIHAVESVVDKVSDTLGSHKGDSGHK